MHENGCETNYLSPPPPLTTTTTTTIIIIIIKLIIPDFMFQLNAPFAYYIYQLPLHVSSNIVLIIRRIHCIHTDAVCIQ